MCEIKEFIENINEGTILEFSDEPSISLSFPKHKRIYNVATIGATDPRISGVQDALISAPLTKERVMSLNNVEIFGQNFLISEGDKFVPELFPDYLVNLMNKGGYDEMLSKSMERISELRTVDRIFLISHTHSRIFGHFLVECMPAIFTVKAFYDAGYNIPIYISGTQPKFILDFIYLIIPDAILVKVSPRVKIVARQLYIPQFYGAAWYPARIVESLELFAKEISNFQASAPKTKSFHKIYISRSGIAKNDRRLWLNALEAEELAKQRDYTVIKPEQLSVTDQIIAFNSAKIIVGEYGSGLHNSIFSMRGTTIIAVNWLNAVQQSLAVNFGHRLIFVLPKGGYPALVPKSVDEEGRKFEVDISQLNTAMKFAETTNAPL